MRRAENPPNPLLPSRCERDALDAGDCGDANSAGGKGASTAARLRIHEEHARSILTHNNSPDIPYSWSVNPYRGCQHGCAYCYARCTHEYLDLGAGSDFDSHIFVKTNAPELLSDALSRPRWTHEQVAFSGVTDCYQPIEADYRLTCRCLEVCWQHDTPVGIVTKSDLITRDIDLLVEFNRRPGTTVALSIPHISPTVSAKLEPGAPSPERRFAAMRALHDAGVPVSLLAAPIIPGLNDRDIPALLTRAAECGATRADYSPVRLPGRVADVFFGRLRCELPDAAVRVEARIREMRGGQLNNPGFGDRMAGHGVYWESVQRLFETFATRVGIDCGQPWRACPPASATPQPRQLDLF